jgi:hypothetical protein
MHHAVELSPKKPFFSTFERVAQLAQKPDGRDKTP